MWHQSNAKLSGASISKYTPIICGCLHSVSCPTSRLLHEPYFIQLLFPQTIHSHLAICKTNDIIKSRSKARVRISSSDLFTGEQWSKQGCIMCSVAFQPLNAPSREEKEAFLQNRDESSAKRGVLFLWGSLSQGPNQITPKKTLQSTRKYSSSARKFVK